MKYILQMIVDESAWQNLTPEQMQPMIDEMERFNDQLRNGGAWVSGEGLDFSSNAKTVRVTDGERTVTDGPYGSAQEQLGGLWIIEAESIDDAVRWAKQVPMTNGSIEVRGLVPEE
ncbi:MAG: YciI family protein [Chloroflexi bacterium]|nr:YciI family protein [Chloroflexota bacterium]